MAYFKSFWHWLLLLKNETIPVNIVTACVLFSAHSSLDLETLKCCRIEKVTARECCPVHDLKTYTSMSSTAGNLICTLKSI